MNEKEIRFIDLFSGIGGFRLGLERANNHRYLQQKDSERTDSSKDKLEQRKYDNFAESKREKQRRDEKNLPNNKQLRISTKQFRCIWYNDFDKYAVQTYNKNFHEAYEPTDIREVKTESIPDFELLCAGFPCQSFSIAGKRKGFEDTRGTLFFEICRIVRIKRPKILFLENVKGLLSHDGGATFATILQSLDELGYDVEWQVLNSKYFVPQNRERVFIVGHLRGASIEKIFPIQENGEKAVKLQGQKVGSIVARRGEAQSDGDYIIESDWKTQRKETRVFETGKFGENIAREYKNMSPTLQQSMGTGGNNIPMVMPILTPDRMNKRQHGRRIRRLTPIECERLQGFPDNWTKGVSDTQRYKQMGNAVTVNVIEFIGRRILESCV